MSCFKIKMYARPSRLRWRWGCLLPPGARRTKTAPPAATATETLTPLAPGPNDARIAYWTARLLEEWHYSQQMLDKTMSEKFFDGYLETLDPRRENFLQSDIDGFAHYRTNLDTLTVGGSSRADLTPAYEIFERFLERLQQHTDYVNQLLKQDRFKFQHRRTHRDSTAAMRRIRRIWPRRRNCGASSCATSICRKNWTWNSRRPTAARFCRCPKPPTRTSPANWRSVTTGPCTRSPIGTAAMFCSFISTRSPTPTTRTRITSTSSTRRIFASA